MRFAMISWAFFAFYLSFLAVVAKGGDFSNSRILNDAVDLQVEGNKQFSSYNCPLPFGVFPDPDDCSRYYLCVLGKSFHKKCGYFQNFDIFRKKCLPILIAICGNKGGKTTAGPTDITTPSEKDETFRCTSITGSFPHPRNCWQYYSCLFYIPSLKNCPEGQLFDAIKKACKPENEVHCGDRERQTKYTTAIVSSTSSDIFTDSTTNEDDQVTTSEITSTDANSSEETTDVEETTPRPTGPPDTDCEEDDLDCIITDTGDVSNWFICPEAEGNHVHPSSDKLFIICLNWIPSAKKCGQDLVFSKKLLACVLKEDM